LTELLAKRTDRLKDVLDVERELASTREEVERMEAEQRNLQQLVNYASIEVNLREEYKPLGILRRRLQVRECAMPLWMVTTRLWKMV